jgi:hypothetical protein
LSSTPNWSASKCPLDQRGLDDVAFNPFRFEKCLDALRRNGWLFWLLATEINEERPGLVLVQLSVKEERHLAVLEVLVQGATVTEVARRCAASLVRQDILKKLTGPGSAAGRVDLLLQVCH